MATQTKGSDTFYVGLCMAGAVSAGAYTAGVMDYLLEALNEWEKRSGQPGVPTHKVQIPVMGGASAGGMTSVMASASLNNPLPPIDKPTADLLAEHPENKLYHSWVDLTGVDVFSQMLDTSDIQPGAVVSALNSDFINPIADRVVAADPAQWIPLPRFIKPGLKIFTTLSNLQGFPYCVPFHGASVTNKDKYRMVIHNDYACFQLTEDTISGDNGGWIPLNLKTKQNADTAANAAMATGAFPVGLKSRLLNRDASYVNANPWLKDYFKVSAVKEGNYKSLNVDGGLINNEPFDKVRSILTDETNQPDENDYNDFSKFRSTILMIEPFPTKPSPQISFSQDLLNVIGLTLSSMITQMRAKPLDVESAMNETCAGQYLITPARRITGPDGKEADLAGELAIACGALNGFSGFINKEFRVHDYFLGRYNCKIFLRDYFTVPDSAVDGGIDKNGNDLANPIFRDGYANATKVKFKSHQPDGGYQVIPVFEDATDYTFPHFKFNSGSNWPVIQESDIDKYKSQLKRRAQAIALNVNKMSKLSKGVLWLILKIKANSYISNMLIKAIKSSLVQWKLLPANNQS